MVLQEVYFGKEPIAPLQKQLTAVRDAVGQKQVTTTTNLDPEILKFNRMVEKVFGFSSYALYVQPDHVPNAYAIPVDAYFTDEDKMRIHHSLVANPTGFKYNASTMGANISLISAVNIGVLENPEFTDEEIMGALLHEIGHGFFEAVTDEEGEYTIAKKLVNSLSYTMSCAKEAIKNGKNVSIQTVDKQLSNISRYTGNLKRKISHIIRNAKRKVFGESMSQNMNKKRLDYTNEKFADTFAAMFGYAEECHSFDVKAYKWIYDSYHGVKTYPRIVETLKMYKMYIKDLLAYAFNTQDEHPEELARIKTAVDYIKRELSKEGLDPKIKNQLVDQLNKLNKLIDDYKNFPKDKDSMRILRLYHTKLYEKFGGDRREQDTDNDALFAAIDQRYQQLIDDLNNGTNSVNDESAIDDVNAMDVYDESAIGNITKSVVNVSDLFKQWNKSTGSFVKHKWIYRYVNEKTKAAIMKHYEILCNEKTNYSTYKRSFAAVCKFFGLPANGVILENITFQKNGEDKDQDAVYCKYSKGLVKVNIPDGVHLIHSTTVDIDEVRPSFRSKIKGKYMYPNKRCYFTCIKAIEAKNAGLEGTKTRKYTPKTPIRTAYIDPACTDFKSNAVYVETDVPIPVMNYRTFLDKIKDKFFGNKDQEEKKED